MASLCDTYNRNKVAFECHLTHAIGRDVTPKQFESDWELGTTESDTAVVWH